MLGRTHCRSRKLSSANSVHICKQWSGWIFTCMRHCRLPENINGARLDSVCNESFPAFMYQESYGTKSPLSLFQWDI